MRHDKGREAKALEQSAQLPAHSRAGMCVEGGERLVEEEDAWVARKRPCERDALALSARELSGLEAGERLDPEAREQLAAVLPAAVGDVVRHGHVREERVVLEDEPDRSLLRP